MNATRETELRSLGIQHFYKLSQILNDLKVESWKILMGQVKLPDGTERFSAHDMLLIETAATATKTAAEIFLDEWSSMGRQRPTVGLLLDMLLEAGLMRAANYLTTHVLKCPVQSKPVDDPEAGVSSPNQCTIGAQFISQSLSKDQNNSPPDSPRPCTSVEPEELSDLIGFSKSVKIEDDYLEHQLEELNTSQIPVCILERNDIVNESSNKTRNHTENESFTQSHIDTSDDQSSSNESSQSSRSICTGEDESLNNHLPRVLDKYNAP